MEFSNAKVQLFVSTLKFKILVPVKLPSTSISIIFDTSTLTSVMKKIDDI